MREELINILFFNDLNYVTSNINSVTPLYQLFAIFEE